MDDDTASPPQARLRFWGVLNEFLRRPQRDTTIGYTLREAVSVKDAIESLGVPHPEVDLIVVGSGVVDFSYTLREGDQVEVFPVGDDDRPAEYHGRSLRPTPAPVFVLDAHLGTLARYLRMLGFDTWYRNDYDDLELAQIAGTIGRILLTRDRGLLKRGAVLHGYYVRQTDPRLQVVEILDRFCLRDACVPFRRCTRCNGELEPVAKDAVIDQLPHKTREEFDAFRRCVDCGRVYWPGSHFEAMRRFIDALAPSEG
jgi:uncharacterized protein